ncbi:hypothetical protein GCM10027347_11420 [Larkinella harenae]
MKRIYQVISAFAITVAGCLGISCSSDLLIEKPQDFFSSENAFTDAKTFQLAVNTLYSDARNFIFNDNGSDNGGYPYREYLRMGTDVASVGQKHRPYLMVDFRLFNSTHEAARYFWDKAYQTLIPRANTIIDRAELPTVPWKTEAEKTAILAQARFFRAYAYYTLVNLYGDVPLITREITTPQFEFTRAPKADVLNFIRQDLEYAAQNLPANPGQVAEGQLTSATANMLLGTLYLQLNLPDLAIEATSKIISSGYYRLMTERFGNDPTHSGHFPAGGGDVFSDLFWENNANRSGGNMESIWVLQTANRVPGGAAGASLSRTWGPYYANLIAPNGKQGMTLADSLGGRPVGYIRTTDYFNYTIWSGENARDMRNSPWNIRRNWYYNNKANALYGQKIDFKAVGLIDTIQFIYPMVRKGEGIIESINNSTTPNYKFIVYRLAEAYLLRAEAHLMKGDREKAAADINQLRNRAKAKPITASQVTLDYILDERARELIIEEPRRITLNRLGLWYERTLKYSLNEPAFFYLTKETIQPHHALFPVPLTALDATPGLKQNPNY